MNTVPASVPVLRWAARRARLHDKALTARFCKRIKIPSVCIGLELHFMTPYDMLRIEKAKFVLGAAQ